MAVPVKLKERYELKEVLANGVTGPVFRAWDAAKEREVALKTLTDAPPPEAVQIFSKECEILAALAHPNIVEIFDIGEYADGEAAKPFFVMPLVAGATLEKLIRTGSDRLTVERVVALLSQACCGLQAAHERGVVHRDLQPGKFFLLEDDSVKVAGFGVAHMLDAGPSAARKRSLHYLAPEQFERKPATLASDIYSLGVVAYEALTRRRPFEGVDDAGMAEAALHAVPPAVSEFNPAAGEMLSRAIHKALAKQPWNRYASAREFSETLQKALRNEPIELFDPARLQPRIERATKAFAQGDYQFASEIIGELEAEGHLDPSLTALKHQIADAEKQASIKRLLDAARTRFELGEFPLSLQKIVEVLALDASNAAALELKAALEGKATAAKVEDWHGLAQQSLDRQDLVQAREALQHILDVAPQDPRALQLLAELDRREQERQRLRDERQALSTAAQAAWDSGDVAAALAKLEQVLEFDRKASQTATPEQIAACQEFHTRVQAEKESLDAAHAAALQHIKDGSLPQALAIANEWLAKHPGDTRFQALHSEVEEKQRQELEQLFSGIEREAAAEPDLGRRVNLLERAVADHPGEARFVNALTPLREQRDQVAWFVARARAQEEQGDLNAALVTWRQVGEIYGAYPGLAAETERIAATQAEQAREEVRARWKSQVDAAVGAGDYARAVALCTAAEAELPGDAAIAELSQQAARAVASAEEARKLLAQGQTLLEQQWFDEGLGAMRKALELDPHNTGIRTAVLNALVARASTLIDSDWRAAVQLLDQALAIDPEHELAKTLRSKEKDYHRDEAVNRCFADARQFRASGNLEAALAEVDKSLAAYPQDPRLAQLRDILNKELAESGGTVAAPAEPAQPPQPAAAAVSETVEAAPPPEPACVKEPVIAEVAEEPAPPVAKVPLPAAPLPVARRKPDLRKNLTWGLAAAGVTLFFLSGGLLVSGKFRRPGAAGAGILLDVRTVPTGATIRVNGKIRGASNFRLEDGPGTYRIEANLEGYQAASTVAELQRGVPAPAVDLRLQPLPQTVRLIADLSDGKTSLDNQPPKDLQDGQAGFDEVSPGRHSLKLASRAGQAQMDFDLAPGALPQVVAPLRAKDLAGVVVGGFGSRARIYTTLANATARLDGAAAGSIGPEGLDLTGLTSGPHELVITDGKTQLKKVIETTAAPVLSTFLQSDQNIGTIVVVTGGVDGADVLIDGKKYRRQTAGGGQLRIPRPPKEYRVTVAKAGFLDAPEQVVKVEKGDEKKVVFQLVPRPTTARLSVQSTPGAQVFVDQSAAGTILPDGTVLVSNLSPGDHTIELRKDRLRSRAIRRSFTAGQMVVLADADLPLRAQTGTLRLAANPSGASMTLARSGGAARNVSGGTMELEEGAYTVTARAAGYLDRTEHVQIAAGQIAALSLTLSREQKKVVNGGMEGWENSAWSREGEWYIRRGGGTVLYRAPGKPGVYGFNLMIASGGGLLRGKSLSWVAGYTDERNYVLYRLEKDGLRRFNVSNGKRTELPRKPHHLNLQGWLASVQLEVTSGGLTTRFRSGDQWVEFDNLPLADRNLAASRFGIVVDGKDEVRLSNFVFYPKD